MINWQDKDSLRRRWNPDVRAVEVHESPEWLVKANRFAVMWSDGLIVHYSSNGKFDVGGMEHPYDIIPCTRSGRGWLRMYTNVIEPSKQSEGEYMRVRWEEVVDETP